METTKPFLYIDLEKSWREEQHPRDQFGKFSSVRGGSRVVTKTGKTGVVQSSDATHHKVRYDDGKLGRVAKESVLHEKDHTKVAEAKKKAERKKKADKKKAEKAKATKEHNKTNGLGKTGAAKPIKPAEEKPKKKKAPSKKERDMKAPVLKRQTTHDESSKEQEVKQTIPRKKVDPEAGKADKQNQALQETKTMDTDLPKSTGAKLADQWEGKDVQSILRKPENKRSADAITKVAGQLTNDNDNLARSVVNKMASARGISQSQNIIGNKATKADKVIRQDTGLYGDMLQSARATMFETISSVLSGSQKPGEGTAITAHVIRRMKDKLHRDMYSWLNDMPAPHEIRGAIGDARKAETTLSQKLGRTPTHEEIANHLQENSKAFREAAIAPAPKWDDKSKTWVAEKKRVEDPSERLHTLNMYANQQKASDIDKNVGKDGEGAVSAGAAMSDRTGASVEEQYEAKERQQELSAALPKAMEDMGLTSDEIKVLTTMYSQGSETGSKANLTAAETAERLKEQGHESADQKWVSNRQAAAFKKIGRAREAGHPAIQELMKYLTKSLFVNNLLKAIFEFELVKSLRDWGVDVSVLRQSYTRTVYADSQDELKKSLLPHEYVGSYVVMDDGEVVARLTELELPDHNSLYKSFNAFNTDLKKSMFAHKDSQGRNHVVNQKATEYVKANAGKYKALQGAQHSRLASKTGQLTWSEQLQKDKGGVWITWGGKKLLINGTDGTILYDSANESHREDHNQGAQADKIDFHHEKDALDEHETNREKATSEAWKEHVKAKEADAAKSRSGKTVDYAKLREDFAKQNRGVSFDEDGNFKFARDEALSDDNSHIVDHGIGVFKQQMDEMREQWGGIRKADRDKNWHKALDKYSKFSDEEKAHLDSLTDDEEKKAFIGKHYMDQDAVHKAAQDYHNAYHSGGDHEAAAEALSSALKEAGANSAGNKSEFSKFLKAVQEHNPASEGNKDALAEHLGQREKSLGVVKHSQKLIPEGRYMIANPITGKTMVVEIGGANTGGRGSKGLAGDGSYTSVIKEAFDPDGRAHFETDADGNISWGSLGTALGFSKKEAQDLKTTLTQKANSDATKPFLKPVSDEEYAKHRANTKLGLQDTMTHKDFKLVNQERNKDGEVTSQTFAQKMEDGTTNHIMTGADGMIKDPLMRRLLNQRKPVTTAEEVNDLLKRGVGNRTWVTAHFGSDIHVGDALGHHVQIEYDGKGAPRVVGGKYDGYRYVDQADVPKGSIDPATGEPVKALFKNGKLVDRRFSTTNQVAMKPGNAVLYPNGKGGFRKGRIHSEAEGGFKVTDGKGHVIGVFSKKELKNATEEGRILSGSGQVSVAMTQTGVHRMNVDEAFAGEKPKARQLFEDALRKAKINTHAFEEGKLKPELELSDTDMRKIQKVLGRSKAGRAMLQKFNSNFTPELEIHVPDEHRAAVEATGVKVGAGGTAKISAAKFEELRNALGGLSVHNNAQQYLADHFKRKDREKKPVEQLRKEYQPSTINSGRKDGFDNHYKAQFKDSSYLMNPEQGLYETQLDGASHLVERKRGIAGHGMGTGKTILGVVAGLHYKADKLAKGEKPKKTLIVAPKGIMSDWGKEIGSHTNSKALYIGSGFKGSKNVDGKKMWGQSGTEQEATSFKEFKKNMESHAGADHDFHIVSYDTFMNNRDHFANSGMYDNIAIDEVHAFKNKGGKRGTALAETTNKFENVWGLSGTPMENDAREIWSLVDTVTGGKHELGSRQEFQNTYMQKDRSGKITGVKESQKEKLGDILANVVQFRGGEDVKYNDGSKIQFPHLAGAEGSEDSPNPKMDFIGNMVDRSRDHGTNNYYGTKHSVVDFNESEVKATRNGEEYSVRAFSPSNLSPSQARMYEAYNQLQAKYLPESKMQELASAAATGYDQGQKGKSNYMTAMQKLQKFLNAPLAHKMYAPGGNAIESTETDAQGEKAGKGGLKPYDPKTGEGHYVVDERGMKRYFESNGMGGFNKNPDGSPVLLPPLHHDNPKAEYLQQRVHTYLDGLREENKARVARGEKPMVPKMVVKSAYTTFGTDIIDNVLKDVRDTHPIFKDLERQGYTGLSQGRFTGDADDREDTKVGFRGNKHSYLDNQGNLWATTVSPAGKEGVDFGNAHVMFHFDQDWNPQKMAQFTARVRRSDSAKTHNAMGRANAVRVESLHMPGTVEDFMFSAQDAKIADVEKVVNETKTAEKNPKLGDTQGTVGYGHRGFTSRKRKVAATPSKAKTAPKAPASPKEPKAPLRKPKTAAASADKALKFVILL